MTNPFIKPKFNTIQAVMLDVIIALLPLIIAGYFAYGIIVLQQIAIAIATALAIEFLFSALLFKKYDSIFDGSAIVTALLLVFTISPVTPWHVVVFGSASAVLFGKLLWGGLGKNKFNPALVGREFMSVFFASIMTSPTIWKTNDLVKTSAKAFFQTNDFDYLSQYFSSLLFKTSGAMGEYSILCLFIGGFYLLLRNRITWHIPFSLLGSFALIMWLLGNSSMSFSLAGIALGTLFMATDLPSSPTTSNGKLYYGMMIGISIFIFIKGGIRFEYMSYSILLLNAFANEVSVVFKPTAWGYKIDWKKKTEAIFFLSLKILGSAFAILSLSYYGLIQYLVFIYIVYSIIKFNFSFTNKINNVI